MNWVLPQSRSRISSGARPSVRHRVEPWQHLAAARPCRPRPLEDPGLRFDSRVVVQGPHRDHDHARSRRRSWDSPSTLAAKRICEPLGLGHLEMTHHRFASVPGECAGNEQVRRMACPSRFSASRTMAVQGTLRFASHGVADTTAQAATGQCLGFHKRGLSKMEETTLLANDPPGDSQCPRAVGPDARQVRPERRLHRPGEQPVDPETDR